MSRNTSSKRSCEQAIQRSLGLEEPKVSFDRIHSDKEAWVTVQSYVQERYSIPPSMTLLWVDDPRGGIREQAQPQWLFAAWGVEYHRTSNNELTRMWEFFL